MLRNPSRSHSIRLLFLLPRLLKNTFTFTREKSAFISPFVGDLENFKTFSSYEHTINHFKVAYKNQPEAYACDLHPGFSFSTQYAKDQARNTTNLSFKFNITMPIWQRVLQKIVGQIVKPAIGVILDGTGLGEDHAIWGGEFLVGDYFNLHASFPPGIFPFAWWKKLQFIHLLRSHSPIYTTITWIRTSATYPLLGISLTHNENYSENN